MRNDSVTKLSHFSESFPIIGPFSFLHYLCQYIKFPIASRLYHLNCNLKRQSDSSLNPLKKDGLSVRNIWKPQVSFLFAFFLIISIDRRGFRDLSLFSARILRF